MLIFMFESDESYAIGKQAHHKKVCPDYHAVGKVPLIIGPMVRSVNLTIFGRSHLS